MNGSTARAPAARSQTKIVRPIRPVSGRIRLTIIGRARPPWIKAGKLGAVHQTLGSPEAWWVCDGLNPPPSRQLTEPAPPPAASSQSLTGQGVWPPTKIAILVHRLRVDAESVHQNSDHERYDDARPRRSYAKPPSDSDESMIERLRGPDLRRCAALR